MPEKRSSGCPTWSDTNWPVYLQQMAGSLKFQIKEEEELHYLYRETTVLISCAVSAQLIFAFVFA